MLPALRAAQVDLQRALGQGGRSSAGLARDPARSAYIMAEVGFALVLLVAAGLLIRTAVAAQNVQPGFAPDRVVTARTALPATVYKTANQVVSAYERILDGLARHAGVRSAALTSKVPLGTSAVGLLLKPNAVIPPLKNELSTELQYISPGYFATMEIPLVRGREFDAHDRAGSAPVAVVNQALARRLWPGQDPVGQLLRLPAFGGESPRWKVIGVVADVHGDGLMILPPTVLYVPFSQVPIDPWHWTEQSLYLVARLQTGTLADSEFLEFALKTVDSQLPLGDIRTMNQRLAQSVSAARFYTLLLTILGFCGLVLTGAGIYGVVAYFVNRQRAEIGVRVALGATRATVLLFVVRQGMRPVLVGIGFGVVASLVTSRALASQLYGVGSMDPITFVAVACLLFAVAILACYVPARQAARVDPMVALRTE
jgi:predicted permease